VTKVPTTTNEPGTSLRSGQEPAVSTIKRQNDSPASALPATAVTESPEVLPSPPFDPLPASRGKKPSVVPALVPAGTVVKKVEIERHEIPAPGQQWSAPHLVVSDILPSSGGERMAIVNGLPVMTGTFVEEAEVREIHPDRVVFEIDGKSVVVPLINNR
jgi:hypothetical protein